MTSEQMNELAVKQNHRKVSNSEAVFAILANGQVIRDWYQISDTIIENVYGEKLTLGVDCFKVVRKRETVVTETWVPV